MAGQQIARCLGLGLASLALFHTGNAQQPGNAQHPESAQQPGNLQQPGNAQQPGAPVDNPTNPQPVTAAEAPSTSVGSDDRVTFRIHAPEATSVTLNGDFLLGSPAVKLDKGADGTWSYVSGPLKPDSYTYNFMVDGVMVLDTRSENFRNTPNSLFIL